MLEGLVRQLLLGYLGRYVKDIQKEQLKITLWNEEVLLENVELILEAFDYLQLPFALKQGRLGRLSIKIPWKKLGWDPIIIILEDVFVCASQRDDREWSLDSVEKREFAGKKAKLAAAELAKLSRCVGDNQAGQSFISYITAKILESIQVSIRNLHVLYYDRWSESEHITFGLKFSSLTVVKQNPIRSYSGWARVGQVNKIVEIMGLEIYCSTFQGTMDFSVENDGNSKLLGNKAFEGKSHDFLLAPCDVSLSLLVNRSGKLDYNAAQYSITAELTGLVISLNEVQLQQILVLWDYLGTCRLREKYGRYRPWCSPLSLKLQGWQILWWHYAQESVLSDIHKKLKKTSWRYFGQRLNYCRKYVNLYKTKLDYLRREQSIDEDILRELEQMEKESDLDDILSYRSAAEHELQEFSSKSSTPKMGINVSGIDVEVSQNDDHSTGKSRGWLNWLSRGMLGAGGTEDSSQFSGVVSDEVIKDIYEATEFYPPVLSNGDSVANDMIYLCAIKFSIHQISATLWSMYGCLSSLLCVDHADKRNEELAGICGAASDIANKITYQPSTGDVPVADTPIGEEGVVDNKHPSCTIQVDLSPNCEVELSVKGMLQPLEVTFDAEFFMSFMEFFDVLKSLSFQQERLLSSLNGIKNANARLLSKAEYILSSRKKVMWDVSIINIVINVPWGNAISEQFDLVLEFGALLFKSKCDLGSFPSKFEEERSNLKNFLNSISTSNCSMSFQLQDLYDHFEVKLNDFEMKMRVPHHTQTISIFEKCCPSITLASCMIMDESILKQLEVYIIVSSLHAHLSPSIYGALLELIAHLGVVFSPKNESVTSETLDPLNMTPNGWTTHIFGFSVNANLESVSVLVDIANNGDYSSALMLSLKDLDIWYALTKSEECWICMKALKITMHPPRGQGESHVLYSCGNASSTISIYQHDIDIGLNDGSDNYNDRDLSTKGGFLLHYKSHRTDLLCHKCTVYLNDADLHCYPYAIGLLTGFFDRLSVYDTSSEGAHSPKVDVEVPNTVPAFGFQRFGFSNFVDNGSFEYPSIPLDHFPFVTLCNSGLLVSLESSLLYPNSEWRKYLNLRDRKIRTPRFGMKEVCKLFHTPPLASASDKEAFHVSGTSSVTDRFVIDLHLCLMRVHFHDSSCIIGTITLPGSKSSLLINEDSMDVLCSIEGLTLTSSWWTRNFHEFLWGPSLPNLSPILNVRVRKEKSRSLSSHFEVSISIQHVYCILPAEYLAIIIGYFSLSEWNSNSKPATEGHKYTGNESSFAYKFEILDCTLIFPVERNEREFLNVEIRQLYSSFIHESISDNVLKEIPIEYLVPPHKFARRNHCLNIFGQDLLLSFLLLKDDGYGNVTFDEDTDCVHITLVAPLSADVWVTMPCESESPDRSSPLTTCVMTRVRNCQIVVDDGHFIDGLEALQDVINQLSSVDNQSKGFKSDVLQFLQLKRRLKEISAVSHVGSSMIFTEVRCYVNSLSVKLHRCGKDSMDLVAKADMQFSCSASLKNDTLSSFGLTFSSLELSSLPNSILLVQCTSTCPSSSVVDISFSKSIHKENELCFSLPSVDIWLHLSDWTKIFDVINSYAGQLTKATLLDSSSKSLALNIVDPLKNMALDVSPSSHHSTSVSTQFSSVNMKQDAVFLIVRSENVGITFYFPLLVTKEACRQLKLADKYKNASQNVSSDAHEENDYIFLVMSLYSRSTGFFIDRRNIKFKSSLENLSGTIAICDNKSVPPWPLFKIYQVDVEAEIGSNQMEVMHVEVEIQCDHSDVRLSHRIFYFLRGVHFNVLEAQSSKFVFGEIHFKARLKKVSLLLSDGRWSCGGPLLEILLRNIILHANVTENNIEGSVAAEFQVNYNNIHKVLWEPFIEPWKFQMAVIRKNEMSALLNSFITTDIQLKSTGQLNLNFTESVIECLSRTIEMIKDAWDLMEPYDHPESQKFLNSPFTKYMSDGRYAPYILQNLTSVPLIYYVYRGLGTPDEFDVSEVRDGNRVQPGSSLPIYINETPEEQLFHCRPAHSSDRLHEQKPNAFTHHFITVQLEGTSVPSAPISMDRVGLTYFEIDFSKAFNDDTEENGTYTRSGFLVPVVLDVSVQRYCKLIRLYSTVVLSNATALPLELRFDIPFGVSPKILDPIYPGQELPLPLHLAEAGRMSWHPIGNSYLWSEYYNLTSLLSQESKIGFLKSFACYPLHASGDPFRCCVSVRNISLHSSDQLKKGGSLHVKETSKKIVESCDLDEPKKRFVHQVTLTTPLVVNNYLPEAVSLTIESSGVTRTAFLSEVKTSFHHIDPSHDLGLEIHIQGFKPSAFKFPRTEKFCTMAKFSGTKFSLSETVTFYPDLSNGPVYVTVEKTIDGFSGARELFIFVPFLLYNCTGFPLLISESADDMKRVGCIIPSCYDMVEQELLLGKKDGLSLLSSSHDSQAMAPPSLRCSSPENHIVSTRENVDLHSAIFFRKPLISSNSLTKSCKISNKIDIDTQKAFLNSSKDRLGSSSLLISRNSNSVGHENEKVRACMYSPNPISSTNEVMVRVSRFLPECLSENLPNSSWSSPFFLVPPSGSTTILVPKSSSNAASLISVTSNTVDGPFAGRTNAITFQPRYVISNACNMDLCYKQKGTDLVFRLGVGEHAHLHWTDTTRELLVSIRYSEPGWQWSGGFLSDHLGDTQVKMRNYVSNALNMIRVEVQNADVSIGDEKVVGSLHGSSGTNLILLSDDDTGYMPYRIDNFSKERLRIYQQKCETFETIVHSYTSCPYAWDEPCYPHRLTVEVPGERVLGSYVLDDVKEYLPVYLPSSSEKLERTLRLSVHAEGATKVFCVIDSSYHILNDMKNSSVYQFREKQKHAQRQEKLVDYKEKLSVAIPHVGISLINSDPQELLFACVKNLTIDLLRSLDQQKFSFQISSLQIDNQLRTTPYPIILSFDHEYRSTLAGQIRTYDNSAKARNEKLLPMASDNSCEPVFYLAVSNWRKKDISLVSFEYISLRIADFRLELEQEVILSLFGFFRNVSSRFQSRGLPFSDPLPRPHICDTGLVKESLTHVQRCESLNGREDQFLSINVPVFNENNGDSLSLPSVVPIGAPWQKIYLLARRQQKIYIEVFDVTPIKLTLSFSSSPWMLRNGILTSGESLLHSGIMALADVEGAHIHLKQLTIAHHMASWESIQEIVIRHYTRQLLHEMYKVFGSAGVIGNPMGFARSLGLGIRDFLSMPARSILQSPTGLITGMAQGSTSLLSNTVYAITDAATQFSKAAQKGIVAFTFDDQAVSRMEKQQMSAASHSKGVINEVLEGLTGLLQSPIKGAEKHGLPGVLSGIALGVTGLLAKPAASILEVTGKTAQSIRNRSRLYQTGPQRFRARLPRPLSKEFPLRPYSWEEAVGTSVLVEADNGSKLKDEVLVMCKALKQAGKFVMITERFVLIVSCLGLVDLGKPEFQGIAADPKWIIESEIGLESVIHADTDQGVVHIVGSSPDTLLRQNQHHPRKSSGMKTVRWNNPPTTLPLFQTNLELAREEDAENLLQILLSTLELGKERGWGCGHLLHQSNIK
ncbi:hypothetical protein FH972_016258 [Carpinus fangiana]|uniref:PH domain-containing protein n=1 Tax=Carpinus fangiana TaxID=176857 RepID=A0A5N6RGG9_9ROSI|nr:hypothetical protein FH972_016258 [Carpinus fangiana]